jgi:hypothetical protein
MASMFTGNETPAKIFTQKLGTLSAFGYFRSNNLGKITFGLLWALQTAKPHI